MPREVRAINTDYIVRKRETRESVYKMKAEIVCQTWTSEDDNETLINELNTYASENFMSRSRWDAIAVRGAINSLFGVKKNSNSASDTRAHKRHEGT